MTGMCEIFNKKPSEFIFNTYYEIFKNFTDEQFNHAVTQCVREHKYNTLPKPADILEFVEGTRHDRAWMAWLQAKDAVKIAGYYNTVVFKDPIISNCIERLGGWMEFNRVEIKELPHIERRFLDLYRTLSKRELPEVPMIGYIDSVNINKGYDHSESVKIGFSGQKTVKKIQKKINL